MFKADIETEETHEGVNGMAITYTIPGFPVVISSYYDGRQRRTVRLSHECCRT